MTPPAKLAISLTPQSLVAASQAGLIGDTSIPSTFSLPPPDRFSPNIFREVSWSTPSSLEENSSYYPYAFADHDAFVMSDKGLEIKTSTSTDITDEQRKILAGISSRAATRVIQRIKDGFPNSTQELLIKSRDAFLMAAKTFMSRTHICGAQETLDYAIATLLNPSSQPREIRDVFYELVRLANFMNSGRKLDGISVLFQGIVIDGWSCSNDYFTPLRFKSDALVNATEDDSLIEINAMRLDGVSGKILWALLERSEPFYTSDVVRYSYNGNGVDFERDARQLANRLLIYEKLIEMGEAEKLEFHITSLYPVPDYVLQAMYMLFGEGALEVIQYDDIYESAGTLLGPPSLVELEVEALPSSDDAPNTQVEINSDPGFDDEIIDETDEPASTLRSAELIALHALAAADTQNSASSKPPPIGVDEVTAE